MRRATWLLLALAACNGPKAPWPTAPALALDLKIEVSAAEVALLQPITVHLDLYRGADLEVEFAPAVDDADFLSEIEVLPEVAFGEGHWRRTTLTLRAVRGPGELVLPAFEARAVDGSVAASTPEQRFTVSSVLAGHGDELEAPAAPFPSPPRTLLYIAIGVGVLLLLAGLWWFARRRRSRPLPQEIAQPPHIVALRALARLRSARRTTIAEIEAFYVEVSSVLRRYLEGRFGLHAPERTTEEFLRDLDAGSGLAQQHRFELQQFLSQCDLVKFAAHRPQEGDHLTTFGLAEAFVERTRPDRAPVEVTA